MKAALHRSLTFWFGLLVMAFVCWAWWSGPRRPVVLAHGAFEAGNYGSGVALIFNPHPSYTPPLLPIDPPLPSDPQGLPLFLRGGEDPFQRIPPQVEVDGVSEGRIYTLREFLFANNSYQSPSYRALVIPHWLILLAVAAVWLGLLFMRARIRNKTHFVRK